MAKRKSRKDIVKKVDTTKPLTPIELTKLGTEDDPCFGKHFDLTADECKICGDCNVCSIVFNATTEKKRDKVEKEHRFKDLELEGKKKDKHLKETKESKLVKRLLEKGMPTIKIVKRLVSKFEMDKAKAKKLVKSIKK